MSQSIETVIVKGGAYGSYIINKCDFNEDEHELFEEIETLDREALILEATALGLEFAPKIGAKKLLSLIEATKAKTE